MLAILTLPTALSSCGHITLAIEPIISYLNSLEGIYGIKNSNCFTCTEIPHLESFAQNMKSLRIADMTKFIGPSVTLTESGENSLSTVTLS